MEISTLAMMGTAGICLLAKGLLPHKREPQEESESTKQQQFDRSLRRLADDRMQHNGEDAACNEGAERPN